MRIVRVDLLAARRRDGQRRQRAPRARRRDRAAYELDDLPAVQAFVAAGIAAVPSTG
jgi:hypothetical protein